MRIQEKIRSMVYRIHIICLYLPLYVKMLSYCIKYKTTPTILWKVNPSFPYGGLIAYKTKILEKFREDEQIFADFFCNTFAVSVKDTPQQRMEKIKAAIAQYNLRYPFILKPDDGMGGIGLRFIENEEVLVRVITKIKKDYLLQEYIPRPLELSVFFIKHPGENGKIRSLTRRHTIKMNNEPELMIPKRKIICTDESHRITPVLEETFNSIAMVDGFYFGRFDLRVEDMDVFVSQGKGFKIIEVNVGAHSMALHAFDAKYSRRERYNIFFNQLKYAFAIAHENKDILLYPDQNFGDFFRGFLRIFKNVSNQ